MPVSCITWNSCLLCVFVGRFPALTRSNEIRESSKALLYLIFAKDISLGDAEQQGIGDLPGSTGHQNSNGLRLQGHKNWAGQCAQVRLWGASVDCPGYALGLFLST